MTKKIIEKYIPQNIILDGVEYQEGVQNVPKTVADYIDADPILSKVKQPKPVDKYNYMKRLDLSNLEALLRDTYQTPIENINHQIDIKTMMGATLSEMRKQLQYLDSLKAEYAEVLAYVEPTLKTKRKEEVERQQKLKEWAEERGGTFGYSATGYPQMSLKKEVVNVQKQTPSSTPKQINIPGGYK